MAITLSARKFSQQVAQAKRSAKNGPVFITERGVSTHVLLDIAQYQKITGKQKNIGELLGDASVADIEIELPVRRIEKVGFDFDE